MENKLKPTMYFVRVYEGSCHFEYEYGNREQAESHLKWERDNGHRATLFAHHWNGKTGWDEPIVST